MERAKPKRTVARRVLRWALLAWLVLLLVGCGVLLWRTSRFESRQPRVAKEEIRIGDLGAKVERLAQAIRFRTTSTDSGQPSATALYKLHEHLRLSFPQVHKTLVRENIAEYSLLYTWRGQEPELPALILAGHLDVVPADPTRWSHEPFSGYSDGEYLYGRGSMDDKVTVLATLEAAEQLLAEGFVPRRTIYFAFGHDEEVGGYHGAQAIAEMLQARGVVAEATIDEGMIITEGIMDGIAAPVALIGIAEKGFMNLELIAIGDGGHSSMPPKQTAVGVLSQAIVRMQDHAFAASFSASVDQMLAYVGPEFSFGRRLVMANLWLFGGMVQSSFAEKPATDALLRTTMAPTMLQGSTKSNVLPQQARAVVNFRIKPGDDDQSVLTHLEGTIDDGRVTLRVMDYVPPQPASSSDSRIFGIMQRTLRSIDPEIIVAPGLMIAMTDSRHYAALSQNIYRFTAMRLGPEDLSRLHGTNERIAIKNYAEIITFNLRMIRAACE